MLSLGVTVGKTIGFALILCVAAVLGFQNCSKVDFSSEKIAGGTVGPLGPSDPYQESNDVEGGHFDLDTATAVYADGKGETNKHVHEYDDKHKSNVADFFNLLDDGFDNINATIAADQAFYIRVANADLSQRVLLQINGTNYPVSIIQHGPYSLSGAAGTTKLVSLKAIVATDAILNSGLVSTQTGCVRANDFSADGRYRNGALLFQAIPIDQLAALDPLQGVATTNQALLWEAALFWHEDGGDCR